MNYPPILKKGDCVAIVCTARKLTKNDILPAKQLLENWGLQVKLGKTIGLEDHQFGGDITARTEDFQTMLNDNNIKAIWCARGGYGTVQIIDNLDFSTSTDQPKWIIGFSDITVLHSHLNTLGVASVHGIMPITVATATNNAKDSLKNILFGKEINYNFPSSTASIYGEAKGELVGGNLSILYSLLGSKSAINTKDKILFIEDLDEYLYHIDRMLQNLKRNNYFSNLKGLIVGGMTDMNDNTIPFGKTAIEIITTIVQPYNIPIAFHFPAGHLADNTALFFGKKVHLKITKTTTTVTYL